jgi:hypothetical protein
MRRNNLFPVPILFKATRSLMRPRQAALAPEFLWRSAQLGCRNCGFLLLVLFSTFSLTLFVPGAWAAGVLTSNGTLSDTQAKINQAVATGEDGWTVVVGSPGGSYSWSSPLQIPGTVSITVQGAGSYSPDTRPTINITHSQSAGVSINVRNGKVIRLTNLKFTDSGSPLTTIQVDGWSSQPSWRVDHIRFDNIADRTIIVGGPDSSAGGIGPYGLVDNCWFESTGNANRGLYLYFGNDSHSWTTANSFGTDKTIVIEDCVFHRTGGTVPGLPAIDSAYGGVRWLMRYCTLTNWVAVLHGADSAPTSTLQVEFNHNTVRVNDPVDYVLYIRGGTGVATGNDIGISGSENNSGYNSAFKMVQDGPCGGGYPCFQQPGRGVVNGAEGSVPLYFWNNTYNLGNAANGEVWDTEGNSHIQLNRDFFLSAKPGYTELAYPHPLRSGGVPDPQLPTAPTNLSAIAQ